MLNRISAPLDAKTAGSLYLLDTNVVYSICKKRDRHNSQSKNVSYQDAIADAILSGSFRHGVVTDAVVWELYVDSKWSRRLKEFDAGIEGIANDPNVSLYHLEVDMRGDPDRSDMYCYLKSNLRKKGEVKKHADEGEASILIGAYETGIPNVVTDDGMVFKEQVKNYPWIWGGKRPGPGPSNSSGWSESQVRSRGSTTTHISSQVACGSAQ